MESPAIRKAIEAVYSTYLPKNTHPWVYLSLEMDPRNVDVNVHPTKREVHFMNEEEVIATICEAIQDRLGDANVSRNFLTQTLLPQVSAISRTEDGSKKPGSLSFLAEKLQPTSPFTPLITQVLIYFFIYHSLFLSAPKVYEYNQVRTDSRAQTLDSFLVSASPYTISNSSSHKRIKVGVDPSEDIDGDQEMNIDSDGEHSNSSDIVSSGETAEGGTSGSLLNKIGQFKRDPLMKSSSGNGGTQSQGRTSSNGSGSLRTGSQTRLSGGLRAKAPRVEVKLTSVLQLRDEVKKQGHPILTPIFANHTFVGILDNQRGLIQNELALYLVNYEAISEELFYQICLRDFSNFGFIRLSNPVSIKDMVRMALDDEQELMEKDEWPEELKPKDEIAQVRFTILSSSLVLLISLYHYRYLRSSPQPLVIDGGEHIDYSEGDVEGIFFDLHHGRRKALGDSDDGQRIYPQP